MQIRMAYQTYEQKIRKLMERLDVTQGGLGRLIGATQPSVSRWFNGTRPDPEYADKIDHLWTLHFPEERKTRIRAQSVPVMGLVGAGSEIFTEAEQIPVDGLFQMEFMIEPNDIIAFEVRGDSMYPRYDDGDIVVCSSHSTEAADSIGKEAAILTSDGRRFLKRLRKGTKPGLYTLDSHNAPPVEDVEIKWLSEITHVARRGQWGKM